MFGRGTEKAGRNWETSEMRRRDKHGKKGGVNGPLCIFATTVVLVFDQDSIIDFVVYFLEALGGLFNAKNERNADVAAEQVAAVHGLC